MKRPEYLIEKLYQNYEEYSNAVFYERMELVEEAWELYGHLPAGERYARTFAYVAAKMSPVIQKWELVVGKIPETNLNQEQERRYESLCRLPGNSFDPAITIGSSEAMGEVDTSVSYERYAPKWFSAWGHNTMDWGFLLQHGIEGILEMIKKRQGDPDLDQEQQAFYKNAEIAAKGLAVLAQRYREYAARMFDEETDPVWKKELGKIVDIFSRAVVKPAESLREAVQTVWLVNMALHGICGARDYSFGRMDQYLYPYYRKDIENGRETPESALELFRCLFIKIPEMGGFQSHIYQTKRILHNNSLVYVILGGTNEKGEDVTNELSDLLLEAQAKNQLKTPTVFVRYHKGIDERFYRRAVEIMKEGRGDPGFYNDEKVVQSLCASGKLTPEHARGYAHYACANINLPGEDDELRESFHNYPKYLEYAMNAGKCYITEMEKVPSIRPPQQIGSMEELLKELRKVIAYAIRRSCEKQKAGDKAWNEIRPFSPESLFLPCCLKKGYDMTSGKALPFRHMNQHATGIATVGNSLYAIHKLVFEQKRFTLAEFSQILRDNWVGYEILRKEIVQEFPKFGNDREEADQFTVLAAQIFCEEVAKQSPIQGNGRNLIPSFYSLHNAPTFGNICGASADGRKAKEILSENQSPAYGTDKEGPTALLNSVAKLPFHVAGATGILNLLMQPELLKGERGSLALGTLIKGYFEQGGFGIQMMAVSKEELQDAKIHPEKHKNLLVRVTGFSANFITLPPEVQDEIIQRTALA